MKLVFNALVCAWTSSGSRPHGSANNKQCSAAIYSDDVTVMKKRRKKTKDTREKDEAHAKHYFMFLKLPSI